MPSPKAKDIPKIIENSAQIMEDMIRALFFYGYVLSVSEGVGSYMICFQLKYPTKYSIISMDESSNMGNLSFS